MDTKLVLKAIFVILWTQLAMTKETEIDQQSKRWNRICRIKKPDLVTFHLYPSAANTNYSEEIKFGDQNSLIKSSFSSSKSMIFLIHGFFDNGTTRFPQVIKDAYLQNGYAETHNIIAVDWGRLSHPCSFDVMWSRDLQYPFAVLNVPTVGQRVAQFIIFALKATGTYNFQDVHIVGFSLGAHVSGLAGKYVQKQASQSVGRITGLDPAGPLFGIPVPLQHRLKPAYATFTNVIHTDIGEKGIVEAIGHADFYPNGGIPPQPGCISNDVEDTVSCSHRISWVHYIHSMTHNITTCKCSDYISYKLSCNQTCPDATLFGEKTPPTARGKYFFQIVLKDPSSS